MRLIPMLQVDDVAASSAWYQAVVGLESGHGGDEFEMLLHAGQLLLELHHLDAHEHGALALDAASPRGAGVSLWFEHEDRAAFEAAFERAVEAGAAVLEGANWNPVAHHHEATLRDPDGYLVMLCGPFQPEP